MRRDVIGLWLGVRTPETAVASMAIAEMAMLRRIVRVCKGVEVDCRAEDAI